MWRFIVLLSLFFPLVHNEVIRYPLHIEKAQSVSTLLIITGITCGEINYKMIGNHPYSPEATLYLWNEGDCEQEEFYITTGFWWADYVCTPGRCVEVGSP